MRRLAVLPILLFIVSCGTSKKENLSYVPPVQKSPLDERISGKPSQELPISSPINLKKLDLCTRHLLFADQYITASDYEEAKDEIEDAKKYCSPSDPRLLYMEAVYSDIQENKNKAYKLYYRAAKGYLKKGDLDSAFKCYSGMLSINPNGKEVKELKKYFTDDDY
jgi:tetratricopeptide (TPR) repeat protein